MVKVSLSNRCGSTLVEAIISIFIVAFLLVPSIGVFTQIARNYYRQSSRDRASLLAHDLMSEIQQSLYQESDANTRVFGLETGEDTGTRVQFDDVDDYRDYSESPPFTKDGTEFVDCDEYSRSVQVKFVEPKNGFFNSVVASSVKAIVVTVTGPTGKTTQVVALRSSCGAFDANPVVESRHCRRVDVSLTRGSKNGTTSASTQLMNQFPQSILGD